MARPSKFDRDAAVGTVMQEIWSNGYEVSSVKALSEKLGITRSSFYNAFGSREKLFAAVLKRYAAQSPDKVLASVPDGARIGLVLTDAFRAVCHARASDTQHRGCMIVNTLNETHGSHQEVAALVGTHVSNSLKIFEALVARAQANGEIGTNVDVKATALTLQCALVGINTMSRVVHDEAQLWAAASAVLQGLGLFEER